ncbi:MAG: undecaprenyldiphospho-muramoylpentapeptide beta-N-acetylglucosaminyltransferase [Clostridia bacterium]|nr:undecaprenyldiphospho-muramoylpentapeptide beta-N-acetylglucosaminyltransferase [Clostridia bacterium]
MKVVIAGGGTGGHIYPGIAIAKYLQSRDKDIDIIFIGTRKGLEMDLVPREGYKLELISVSGFERKISFDTLLTVKKAFKGLSESKRILRQFKPDIVIGTGGYVCGPVVFSSWLMGIPAIIHEQNVIPGVANKLSAKFVKKIAISFEESKKYFKNKSKLVYTGNPIRGEILKADRKKALASLGLSEDTPIIMSAGGSRGARPLNEAMVDLIDKNIKRNRRYQVIMSTGKNQYEHVLGMLKDKKIDVDKTKNIRVLPYIYEMENALAASDIVISRAGAIMLSELTALGIPSVLVPSPYVANNHQEYNARALEKAGASIVILEKDLKNIDLESKVFQMINNDKKLKFMRFNSQKLACTDADEKIYNIIKEITL